MIFRLIITLAIINSFIDATLTPKQRKTEKSLEKNRIKSGPLNLTVFDRGLVSEDTDPKAIVRNHQAYFSEVDNYTFDGLVLGYVTPWNNRGYDIAKIFGNKFTHISPAWLQIKRKKNFAYEIVGTHDVDKAWMAHVRNAGRERHLRIVPRVLFSGLTGEDFTDIFYSSQEVKGLTKTFIHCARTYGFDGFVFELWPQYEVQLEYEPLIDLIKSVSGGLAGENLDLILVIPPKRGKNLPFNEGHFNRLYHHVTAFSLMTYDYSNPRKPGPNAPLTWIEDCIKSVSPDKEKRKKILTGFNFYGNHYHEGGLGKPILGKEYVKILEENSQEKMIYDSETGEHYLEYEENGKRLIFYPTLYSIYKRIQLCQSLGTGISIWELGQGLDFFYDLL